MPTFAWLVIAAGAWVATLCATCALLVAAARADAQTPAARASRIADRPAWPVCAAVWMTCSIGSGRASARSSLPLGLGPASRFRSAAAGGAAARVESIRALRRTAGRSLGLALVAAVLAATASPAAASPALTADPTSIDFGSGDIHAQNQNGPFTPVTLTNTSDDPVSVTSVQVSGLDASSFAVNYGCRSVGSGQSCQVQVAFRPTHPGAVSANLVV